MPSIELMWKNEFHAVGQGLFASGWLRKESDNRPRFHWVYDCGTSSTQQLVMHAIGKLVRECGRRPSGKGSLDLVTISHFDKDHISGLVELLKSFSVRMLVLPYLPLWHRMVLAFSERIDSQQPLINFFANPVAYLANLDGAEIERIVFVPPSEEGPQDRQRDRIPLPQGDGPWPLAGDFADPKDDEQSEDMTAFHAASRNGRTQVMWLRPGGALYAAELWEFVPYNDANISRKPSAAFRTIVAAKRSALLAASTEQDRLAALLAIKEAYDAHFGDDSKNRNAISLFQFGGPIGHKLNSSWVRAYPKPGGLSKSSISPSIVGSWWGTNRSGVLYTGDGYLDTAARLDALVRYMGQRIDNILCLQVMHHGSSRNWHPGVAMRLSPEISVFSSDPTHKRFGHPHAPVVKDFMRYGPIQVDKEVGVLIKGRVAFP